jgi:hypothetical protein
MKKQTAVEFLVDKWSRQGTLYSSDCKQALEMEKQQIINAYDLGSLSDMQYPNPKTLIENGEQYYNETFKSEKDKGCACYGNNAVHKCYCK